MPDMVRFRLVSHTRVIGHRNVFQGQVGSATPGAIRAAGGPGDFVILNPQEFPNLFGDAKQPIPSEPADQVEQEDMMPDALVMEEPVTDDDVEDLQWIDGVGPAYARKLADAGYRSVEAVAEANPVWLASQLGVHEDKAVKIVDAARMIGVQVEESITSTVRDDDPDLRVRKSEE